MESATKNLALPQIDSIDIQQNTLTIKLQVPLEHECFDGHFQDIPLVPGVVQIYWASHFHNKHFPGEPTGKLHKLKFTKPLMPSRKTDLTIEHLLDRFSFNYRQGQETIAQGVVFLEQSSSSSAS